MPDETIETDPAALNSAEDLDEDSLRLDPLEEGIEPPERWSGADRYGTTAREESEPRPLDERLDEEEPERLEAELAGLEAADPEADLEVADLEADLEVADLEADLEVADLEAVDPDIETRTGDVDYVGVELDSVPSFRPEDDAVRRGQAADEAGGSVAVSMRQPDDMREPDDTEDTDDDPDDQR